jgi:transposase-like protein
MRNILRCPYCQSEKCHHLKDYETKENGSRSLHICAICNNSFSETKGSFLAGLKKPISLIVGVFKARTDGLSFNATCRVFNIAKNTLLDWEHKFQDIKPTLLMYAMLNTFISSKIIEGDELYTKIEKNVPVEECQGWTILLMERATRFIWALGCGKKDRTLFYNALQLLRDVITRTGDVTLVTDGERRYGNILFEICHDVVHNGKRGRPPKVLLKGLKVRLKNKGDRSSKKKLARQKYEAPQNEHPQTIQNVSDSDIHANHAEAFNSSIRRKNSAYRRKTNTYAKSTTGLQRTLDIHWIAHNFIFEHFTTKQVPAVALGILKEGLSWAKVFQIRKPYII